MRCALPFLASALVLSCFEGPTAGEVTLSLKTPNADDGAVAFVVTIPAPNEITGASAACDGCDVFTTQVSATELRGIVTGDLSAGPAGGVGGARAGAEPRQPLLSQGLFGAPQAAVSGGVLQGTLFVPTILIAFKNTNVGALPDSAQYNQIHYTTTPLTGRSYTVRTFYEEMSHGVFSVQG